MSDFARFTIVQRGPETDQLIEAAAARAGAKAIIEDEHVRFEGASPEEMIDALAAEDDGWDTRVITPKVVE